MSAAGAVELLFRTCSKPAESREQIAPLCSTAEAIDCRSQLHLAAVSFAYKP